VKAFHFSLPLEEAKWFLNGDEFPYSEKSHSTMGNKVVSPFVSTTQDLLFWGKKREKNKKHKYHSHQRK
jgi:hypothetical protein